MYEITLLKMMTLRGQTLIRFFDSSIELIVSLILSATERGAQRYAGGLGRGWVGSKPDPL